MIPSSDHTLTSPEALTAAHTGPASLWWWSPPRTRVPYWKSQYPSKWSFEPEGVFLQGRKELITGAHTDAKTDPDEKTSRKKCNYRESVNKGVMFISVWKQSLTSKQLCWLIWTHRHFFLGPKCPVSLTDSSDEWKYLQLGISLAIQNSDAINFLASLKQQLPPHEVFPNNM